MRLSICFALFVLLAVAATAHRVPLFKHKSSLASRKGPNARHNLKFSSVLAGARSGRPNGQDDPGESDGYGFAIQVQIGTPAQLFHAEVELDKAELWIADSSCNYWTDCDGGCINHCHIFGCEDCCNVPDHCQVNVFYDNSSSSTYQTEGEAWFWNDGLSGILGYDAITLNADLSVPAGEFVQVTSLGSWATPCYGYCPEISGKIGLALAGVSFTNTPSVFEQAYKAGTLEKPLVGLWMNRSNDAAVGDVVGELTFGDWDHAKCGDSVVFVSIAGPDFLWKFWIDGAQIGTYELDKVWRATLDLGFSGWSVPEQLFQTIVADTNSNWDQNIYHYVVDCNQNTPLTLTTDGGDLVIPLSAFSYQYNDDTCVLDIFFDYYGRNGELLFGSQFFASFCGVFDYEKQQFGYAAIN